VAADQTPDHETLPERGPTPEPVFYALVTANRVWLAVFFLAFVPLGLLLGGLLHPSPFEYALVQRAPLQGLYQALVISTVTGATLVLTLSQLVLAEEFGSVGEQRREMKQAMAFRQELEETVEDGTRSARPSELLMALVEEVEGCAGHLDDVTTTVEDEQLVDDVAAFARQLQHDARFTLSQLEPARFGTFRTVTAVFSLDLSAVLYEIHRIRSIAEEPPGTELGEALADLKAVLGLYGSARAHVKGLYFQRELGDLSRWIIYTSFPAIVVAVASLLYFDPTAIDAAWTALTIASLTIAIALTPFAILLAYILRLVKVSQVTFSQSPFLVRES
jgi:hypothetical protein